MSAILFYSIYILLWIFSLLPLKILYILSDVLYFFVYYIFRYRKEVVNNNLINAFPEKGSEEIKLITRKYFHHLCDLIMEVFKLIHLRDKDLRKRIKFENIEILDEYFKNGKSIIAVSGHYCNWEWGAAALPLASKHECWAAFKPLSNQHFNVLLNKMRTQYGLNLYTMKETVRSILKNQQNDKITMNLLVSDQIPARGEIHYWTSFLNQDTAYFLGSERIAKKTGFAVVYVAMLKVKRGKYTIKFIPIFDKPEDTDIYEITNKHVSMLEDYIKEIPQYWLWSHKRWKHKRNENKD